jgi:hypothetical protein
MLVVLHSENTGLMVDGVKDHEGKDKKTTAEWIVFVSARVDKPGPSQWETDPKILPGHIYVVAYVLGCEKGIDYKYDWRLEVYPTTKAVECAWVGQGTPRPSLRHADAMRELNSQLPYMQMLNASRVWSFGDEPTPFVNMRGTRAIPQSYVSGYSSAKHKDWDRMSNIGDTMLYKLKARDPCGPWGVPEGTAQLQVKVVGHIYVHKTPVLVLPSVWACVWCMHAGVIGRRGWIPTHPAG